MINYSSLFPDILNTLLAYSEAFDYFSIHVSNNHTEKYDFVAAFGAKKIIHELSEIDLLDGEWKFGILSYDYKNKIEKLTSKNENKHQLSDLIFFVPELVITIQNNNLSVFPCEYEEKVIQQFLKLNYISKKNQSIKLAQSTQKQEYLNAVNKLKSHIQNGDIYEVNYCMNFYHENVSLSSAELFLELNKLSEAPFACYSRFQDHVIISSSPERFISKKQNILITQPIKGTAPRGATKQDENEQIRALRSSEKEQIENVMIVDVSRNDFSRIAERGSVRVDDLFSIKTYKQVHQMVSTVSCELKPKKQFSEIIEATFPPASMTGAPKIRAMELIDEYEPFRRGAYSGSIGFIKPSADFDFNVVIRSIVYNLRDKYLSYSVGSAITAKCNPENEYEECLLKARAMKKVLEQNG